MNETCTPPTAAQHSSARSIPPTPNNTSPSPPSEAPRPTINYPGRKHHQQWSTTTEAAGGSRQSDHFKAERTPVPASTGTGAGRGRRYGRTVRRTLLVTNDFPPRPGGIQSYLHTLATRPPSDDLVVYAPAWHGPPGRHEEFDAAQPFPVVRHPG